MTTVDSDLSLANAIRTDQYAGYAYAYPHKTSYRQLAPPIPLRTAWQTEDRRNLFLYVHLPFCEMRCGFCNLFTASQPSDALVESTLAAIDRQSRVVANAIQPEKVVQIAFGGGTPTYLNADELQRVLCVIKRDWPIEAARLPFSVEVSPATVTLEKLHLLRDFGVSRISMGVQSFIDRDLNQLGRPQSNQQVELAIERIKKVGFDIFNLDLIYGHENQAEEDWLSTIESALSFQPDEIFLYPLYVRQMTGLGRTGRTAGENRRHLYLAGKQRLHAAGYHPISMRMFRHSSATYVSQHCCQEDGMVGLGPGARSYTRNLHYSSDFAVSRSGVRKIISNFCHKTDSEFAQADYGFVLNEDEQSRRYLIRSLLQHKGLSLVDFRAYFGSHLFERLPQVSDLVDQGYAIIDNEYLRLTDLGISYSDVIGPWLYSPPVKANMEAFELR